MKAVQFLNDVPQGDCWIILKNQSTHHEGDERSKNFPGHGYPAHTDYTIEVDVVCETEAEFLDALGSRIRTSHNDGSYRGFKVQSYRTKLVVDASIAPWTPPAEGHGDSGRRATTDGTSRTCWDCQCALFGQCDRHAPHD